MPSRRSPGREWCSPTSWAPTPDRGCGRSRRPSSPRIPSWTCPCGAAPRPRARSPSDVTACPYKGLATYQAADAELFHGRSRVVTSLVARLVDAPLVLVSGASGAGKSSLVRAGLVPALAAGALPGSAGWRAVVLTPGRRPVDALAALTGAVPPDSPVLLVCDQLEELWAPGVDRAERTAFLDTVLGLIEDGIVARCVAVLRGDHVGRLAEHAAFTERLGGALVLVPALTDGELREVVSGPAAAVGLAAEAELLDAVVADVAGRPAALPLLSTALVGTWERRRGDRLTLAGYLEAGGVTGALARSAEEAYAALDDDAQESARRLLVRLADTDEGGALVRRPVPLAELDLEGERGTARRTVVDGVRGAAPAVTRRRAARRHARGAADRMAPPGPVAGGRRRRPRRPAAPDPRRAGVAASGTAGRRAVPRRPARCGPRLGRCGGRRADRRRAGVPRRVEGARRRGAPVRAAAGTDRGSRPTAAAVAGRRTGRGARRRAGDGRAGRAFRAGGRPRHGGGRGDLPGR